MIRHAALLAAAVGLVLVVPAKPLPPTGSWQLDSRHSHAHLSTDGATNDGKTKANFTIGFARMNGTVKLDGENSKFDFRLYPATTSMDPVIDEAGKAKIEWFSNLANNTLVCFHSKGAQKTADGRLKTTGTLVLTRVDRNVELTPSEAYAGPVYGPPMIHKISHEATFVFDFPGADGSGKDGGAILALGDTNIVKEDFPQLVKTAIATYWPPVVEDENCQLPTGVDEGYTGSMCMGMFLQSPSLPSQPTSAGGEGYAGGGSNDSVVGQRLKIAVHMRLTPAGSGAAAGN